jgi:AraC-like DNA-binding protein
MHADANLDDILWKKRRWNGSTADAESKLHDAMLAFAIARRWPDVFSNLLEPGWVPTKMGGPGAPDDMDQAHLTQVWLAAGDDPQADITGQYFYHLKRMEPNPEARDVALQDRLIAICADISGVALPTWAPAFVLSQRTEPVLKTELAIADIAVASGFVDQSRFTRVFSRHVKAVRPPGPGCGDGLARRSRLELNTIGSD